MSWIQQRECLKAQSWEGKGRCKQPYEASANRPLAPLVR